MDKIKNAIALVLGFAGIAGLCIDGGAQLLPLQIVAMGLIAVALLISGAFRKEEDGLLR